MAKQVITIEIESECLFDRIRQQTELVGKKSTTDGDYDAKGMAENERNVFDGYMEIASSDVVNALCHYVSKNDSDEESFCVTLSMPNRFHSTTQYPLIHAIEEYLYYRIIAMWYQVVDKERMPENVVLATASMEKIKKLLLSKTVVPAIYYDEEL